MSEREEHCDACRLPFKPGRGRVKIAEGVTFCQPCHAGFYAIPRGTDLQAFTARVEEWMRKREEAA